MKNAGPFAFDTKLGDSKQIGELCHREGAVDSLLGEVFTKGLWIGWVLSQPFEMGGIDRSCGNPAVANTHQGQFERPSQVAQR